MTVLTTDRPPVTRSLSVPTLEMYDGDFSKWVNAAGVQIPVYDPFTVRTENGRQMGYRFNYKDVINRKNMKQNIELKPGDTVLVP